LASTYTIGRIVWLLLLVLPCKDGDKPQTLATPAKVRVFFGACDELATLRLRQFKQPIKKNVVIASCHKESVRKKQACNQFLNRVFNDLWRYRNTTVGKIPT
jgi:hypothetical protein